MLFTVSLLHFRDLTVELPFMLTHPKPPEDVSPSPSPLPQRRASEIGGSFQSIDPGKHFRFQEEHSILKF